MNGFVLVSQCQLSARAAPALRKRKTELSNFDAYNYTETVPPPTSATAIVQRPPTVRGGLEKCQHQLNVTFARENGWIIS